MKERKLATWLGWLRSAVAGMFVRKYIRLEMETTCGEQTVCIAVEAKNAEEAYRAFLLAQQYAECGHVAEELLNDH